MSDDKLWYTSLLDPEHWAPIEFFEYKPCVCGKTLEQSLMLDGTTMIRMSFNGGLSQTVVCGDCVRKETGE